MLTPRLARRVTFLGGFALAMFAIIFFRLWFLQVLSGQKYVAQASANGSIRSLEIPAPRGDVIDSRGNVLVDNTKELDVDIAPASLPVKLTQLNIGSTPKADKAVYRRLAHVVGMAMAVMVQNVLALAFTVAFAHILGASGYGSLSALVAAFLIPMIPGTAQATDDNSGMNDFPLRPHRAMSLSIRKAARAM